MIRHGEHHFSLQVLTELCRRWLQYRARLESCTCRCPAPACSRYGMTVAREDLALEPLLGAAAREFPDAAAQGTITSRNLRHGRFHNFHWPARAITGRALTVLMTARARHTFLVACERSA